MKSDYDYQLPWRPNFEVQAIGGWIFGAGLAYLADRWSGLPMAPFLGLIVFCGMMAAWRLPAAVGVWYRKHRLRRFTFEYLDVEKLQRTVRRHPDKLWFGWGFDWGQRHAQLAYEILKRDSSDIIPVDHERMGATWVHGLEIKEGEVFQPIAHTAGHTLIVGTTGAGKTRLFDILVTQAVLREEAVIVIDPKGDKDLKGCAERACRLSGHPERFVYFHPAFPEDSVRLDPLRNFNRSSEVASRIATVISGESASDPFKAFGQKSLDNIVQGLFAIEQRPTLVKLRRYLEGGPGTLVVRALERYFDHVLDEGWRGRASIKGRDADARAAALVRFYRESVQADHPNLDLEGLISMFEHDRTHFGKMVASLLPIMNMLTSGTLGSLLSPDPSDVDDPRPITDSARIIQNAQVAYIGLDSLSDGMVGSAIGSILLADLASVAGDRYNYGINNRPVNIFVDEAAEVINDPCIQLLNKGRGAKFRLFIATQTFADFSARTGSEPKARQILGNVNNLIALRVMDAETQEYITDNLPKTRLKYIMRTQGVSTHSTNPAVFSGNIGERLMEEEGDLFAPQLLGQLPDLHYIAKLSGGRIVKGRLPVLRSRLDEKTNRP
ncbi:conjugal transfer protein [Methylocaldum sp. BRCS4]|uniref:conjugative transfer system coupling protein TraD n=1 Tax=Methylocaldum sp. 14B TaxID=1912213 RepID=UPI00098A26F9|nr:conjugative transfer system coupling protein TraD [Methylocaldum sp. 14B]MVF23666.1 conjugal transfer protein [Methylocaldum sp. BRCS4]